MPSLANIRIFGLFLLLSLVIPSLQVSDDNICSTPCDHCCRDHECKSKAECKGSFKAFVIAGIVVGSVLGACLLVWLCKRYVLNKRSSPKKDDKGSKYRTGARKPLASKDKDKSKKKGKNDNDDHELFADDSIAQKEPAGNKKVEFNEVLDIKVDPGHSPSKNGDDDEIDDVDENDTKPKSKTNLEPKKSLEKKTTLNTKEEQKSNGAGSRNELNSKKSMNTSKLDNSKMEKSMTNSTKGRSSSKDPKKSSSSSGKKTTSSSSKDPKKRSGDTKDKDRDRKRSSSKGKKKDDDLFDN